MTPEQRAAEIRRLATQLHEAIAAARADGFNIRWSYDEDRLGRQPGLVLKTPMDKTFSSATIRVTRSL